MVEFKCGSYSGAVGGRRGSINYDSQLLPGRTCNVLSQYNRRVQRRSQMDRAHERSQHAFSAARQRVTSSERLMRAETTPHAREESYNSGDVAHTVERTVSNGEAVGSIPSFSNE